MVALHTLTLAHRRYSLVFIAKSTVGSGQMNENAALALDLICRDYRAAFVPPTLENDWTGERANRGFIALGLAGHNALLRGADRILLHVDALCRVASTKEVAHLIDNPLLEDLAPRTLGLVAPDCEAELLPHLQWLLAAIRGRAGDISSIWREQGLQDAHSALSRIYKDSVAAYVLLREATGERPVITPTAESTEAATRLGIVSWTESVLDRHGAQEALRGILEQYEDDLAWEALEWFAQIQCGSDPRCSTCLVAMDCQAIALGTV